MRLAVEGGGAQVQVQSALLGFVIAGALQEHLGLAAPEATRRRRIVPHIRVFRLYMTSRLAL